MLTVKKDFTYYHKGYDRRDYAAGDVIDIDDEEMIEVAINQQWIESEEKQKPVKRTKAKE